MAYNKVLITVTTGEYARRADFYDYYHMLDKPEGAIISFCHERSPAKARNILIKASREYECTHILFIDDDMSYQGNALKQLLEHDVDIVTGLYLSRAYPHQPIVFDLADEDDRCISMYLTEKPHLKPIVAAGFGFLLCKTEIFDRMDQPYVRLGELDNEEWCDDIGFFKRVREAGIQSYCDMTCLLGHMGTMIVEPEYDEKTNTWYTIYNTGGTGKIKTPQIQPVTEHDYVKTR